MAELLSVMIRLTLVSAPEGFTAPRWWGGFVHGLLLKAVNQQNPHLAEHYHDDPGLKPYTVSDLVGATPRQALDRQADYSLRLTSLTSRLSNLLSRSLAEGLLATDQRISLGDATFTIKGHDFSDPHWCGVDDYQTLSAPQLMPGQKLPNRFTFWLGSPTTFKHGDRFNPLPAPDLVFGALLRRWNHWAPVTFPPDLLRFVEECLVTSRFGLHTRLAGSKNGGLRPGAVGRITFTALHYDGYWISLLHALGAFAKYAGIGSGVTQGMGQACLQ